MPFIANAEQSGTDSGFANGRQHRDDAIGADADPGSSGPTELENRICLISSLAICELRSSPHRQIPDVDILEPHIALAARMQLQGDVAVEGLRRRVGEVDAP